MPSPLVTIGVLTFNSSKTILETLESIKNQTYRDIELVISDDCSSDDTLRLCSDWVERNKNRFVSTIILSVDSNTGLPANYNRIVRASSGTWLKGIAGDDLLLPNCIESYIEYVSSNLSVNVVFSRIQPFRDSDDGRVYEDVYPTVEKLTSFMNKNSKDQLLSLLNDDSLLPAPSAFFRTTFIKDNPFIEKYRYEEDYPMWITLTRKGFRLDIIDAVTVQYRLGDSISRPMDVYYSRNYMRTRSQFFWDECYDLYVANNAEIGYDKYRKALLYSELTEALTSNKRTLTNSVLRRFIHFFVYNCIKYHL